MTDNKSEEQRVVVRKFCTSCDREVLMHEMLIRQTIVVNGGQVVAIQDRLLHKNCGGAVQTLTLQY